MGLDLGEIASVAWKAAPLQFVPGLGPRKADSLLAALPTAGALLKRGWGWWFVFAGVAFLRFVSYIATPTRLILSVSSFRRADWTCSAPPPARFSLPSARAPRVLPYRWYPLSADIRVSVYPCIHPRAEISERAWPKDQQAADALVAMCGHPPPSLITTRTHLHPCTTRVVHPRRA